MLKKTTLSNTMRIYHRYLGFFLAGIMAVYAISGIVLIFRDTDFLKREQKIEKKLSANLSAGDLGKELRIRDLAFKDSSRADRQFKEGRYNVVTGEVSYTMKKLAPFVEKLTHLHKANTKDKLFYLNIFFGLSLFFFVISSFWMFLPGTSIFRKGMYFAAAGLILTLVLLYL